MEAAAVGLKAISQYFCVLLDSCYFVDAERTTELWSRASFPLNVRAKYRTVIYSGYKNTFATYPVVTILATTMTVTSPSLGVGRRY